MARRIRFSLFAIIIPVLSAGVSAQTATPYDSVAIRLVRTALAQNRAISLLSDLCTTAGPRLSGSANAARAVDWGVRTMESLGFQNVHREQVMVPHWERGSGESATLTAGKGTKPERLAITALGGSIATSKDGVKGEIIEITSWDQLRTIGDSAKGKIVFFNRPMDRSLISTGQAYGRAVDQRSRGAVEAAKVGGIAAIVRSMTTRLDDVPHTGMMTYADSVAQIPAAAVSTVGAERIHRLLSEGRRVSVTMKLSCRTLPDAESANVVGELVGTQFPEEVVVVGGHLDSWDKGVGAHDDGSGCVESIEALRLLKDLNLRPKRTIRVVLFMNEENGLRGGTAYAGTHRSGEWHIAAIESDAGGFMPLGFGIGDSTAYDKLVRFAPAFRPFYADHFVRGGGGSDIGPLAKQGVPIIGMTVDWNRYFDVHHSDNDVLSAVNEREIALGSAAMALLAYIIADGGLN